MSNTSPAAARAKANGPWPHSPAVIGKLANGRWLVRYPNGAQEDFYLYDNAVIAAEMFKDGIRTIAEVVA